MQQVAEDDDIDINPFRHRAEILQEQYTELARNFAHVNEQLYYTQRQLIEEGARRLAAEEKVAQLSELNDTLAQEKTSLLNRLDSNLHKYLRKVSAFDSMYRNGIGVVPENQVRAAKERLHAANEQIRTLDATVTKLQKEKSMWKHKHDEVFFLQQQLIAELEARVRSLEQSDGSTTGMGEVEDAALSTVDDGSDSNEGMIYTNSRTERSGDYRLQVENDSQSDSHLVDCTQPTISNRPTQSQPFTSSCVSQSDQVFDSDLAVGRQKARKVQISSGSNAGVKSSPPETLRNLIDDHPNNKKRKREEVLNEIATHGIVTLNSLTQPSSQMGYSVDKTVLSGALESTGRSKDSEREDGNLESGSISQSTLTSVVESGPPKKKKKKKKSSTATVSAPIIRPLTTLGDMTKKSTTFAPSTCGPNLAPLPMPAQSKTVVRHDERQPFEALSVPTPTLPAEDSPGATTNLTTATVRAKKKQKAAMSSQTQKQLLLHPPLHRPKPPPPPPLPPVDTTTPPPPPPPPLPSASSSVQNVSSSGANNDSKIDNHNYANSENGYRVKSSRLSVDEVDHMLFHQKDCGPNVSVYSKNLNNSSSYEDSSGKGSSPEPGDRVGGMSKMQILLQRKIAAEKLLAQKRAMQANA